MNLKGNTILITGGATGIGYGLAEEFLKLENEVIICGRRQSRLEEAKKKLPGIHIKVCDVTKIKDIKELYEWTITNFPNLNIIINNAGIQRNVDFIGNTDALFEEENEITTNVTAPVRLCAFFIPHLMKQKESAIMNVSSGLGFVPLSFMAVYSATKAFLHSFTVSLRHQLRKTSIKVFELIPPMVDTELGGGSREDRHLSYRGMSPKEYALETLKGIEKDEFEIPVGTAVNLVNASHTNSTEAFNRMNH